MSGDDITEITLHGRTYVRNTAGHWAGPFPYLSVELESALDEIVRLRRRTAEATTVIENWEAVFDLLIDPKSADLGVLKSVLVAKEIVRLRCDNGELRTRIEELEASRG